MRQYEAHVQEVKNQLLRAVAELAWEDKLTSGILDIPEIIIPGLNPSTRCCISKERAIVSSRIKPAMGGDKGAPALVEVLPIACDECPISEITVTPACRGCLATRCVQTCPRDALSIINHRAQIDHTKCITCGKCLSVCPYGAIVKNLRPCERGCPVGAITMGEDGRASIDHSKCISCGSCIYQCPFGAIMDKSYILNVIQMLQGAERWGYQVWAAIAPSIAGQFPPATVGQLASGLKILGFHDVVQVAYGADLTAWEESEELAGKGVLASSCCPAFVEYVEKNFSELAEKLVSKTPSPMIMTARRVKGKIPGARVIFIGPCVAKKQEFQLGKTMGAVDCVLTFEELNALFESKGIVPEELEEAPLERGSTYGWGFAASGGVAAAVRQALAAEHDADLELKAMPCSGIDACKMALLKEKKGMLDANFIEGMACDGGCIQGPANIIRSPRNKNELDKQSKLANGVAIKKYSGPPVKTTKGKNNVNIWSNHLDIGAIRANRA